MEHGRPSSQDDHREKSSSDSNASQRWTNNVGGEVGIGSGNLMKIMRKVLPPQAKVTEEAKQTMKVCVSAFISFITCEANDLCRKERRKIVTAEDIICAMDLLGFDDYVDSLIAFLERCRHKEDEMLLGSCHVTVQEEDVVAADSPMLSPSHMHGFKNIDGSGGSGNNMFDPSNI